MTEFVPKKTITVQLPLELIDRFEQMRKALGLTKTQMMKKLIVEADNVLLSK